MEDFKYIYAIVDHVIPWEFKQGDSAIVMAQKRA